MTLSVLLIGPLGHGGEEVYVRSLLENAPPGVDYAFAGGFHQSAPGAPSRVLHEVLLNRIVAPLVRPDGGFRAFTIRRRFDLIHVHQGAAVKLSGLGETPLVISEGSSSVAYFREYCGLSDAALRKKYARARRLYPLLGIQDRFLSSARVTKSYTFSHWARQLSIEWGADAKKLEVIYPGFPTPPAVERRDRETFTFLFVGRDFQRKGGFEVIEAFAIVAARNPKARLVMVASEPGPNPDRAHDQWVSAARQDRALAVRATLAERGVLEIRPLLDRERLFGEVYPRADAFVMPSHAEGFGFTNVEAMGFSLPVVSSRVGAIPEAVSEGKTGILIPPGDSEALADAMERLIRDRSLANAMGMAGRSEFLSRFTLDRLRQSLLRLYRAALEGTPVAPEGRRAT